MSEARLPAALEAAALRRQVEAGGGNTVVLKRGDPDRGALILMIRQRGAYWAMIERGMQPDGAYRWQIAGPKSESSATEISDFLEKRVRFDADCWLIELDVPDAQRFIAESGTIG